MDESALKRDRYRKYRTEVELLLWAVWDPIGLVPLDEYRGYVPGIWRLLEERAGAAAVKTELDRICSEMLEIDTSTNAIAAKRLVAWWRGRFESAELAAED